MRSINKVIIIGNLTRDPEKRETPNGQIVTTFGIATNRDWITRDGIKNSSAEFHECVAWAHLAEICHKYLKKSRLVYIEGYLKTRNWESPEGVKKFKTEVVIKDMIMLEKRKDEEDYIPEAEEDFEPTGAKKSPAPTQEKPQSSEKKAPTAPPEEKTDTTEKNPIDIDLGL